MNDNTPTALAVEQAGHLQKTLRRFDLIFLIIAAVVSVEALGQVSTFGAETFTWALVLAVVFLIPYGMIFAEIGSTFTDEGGVYVWVRKAFGRPLAAVASLFTWVTQPVWVGGAMSFLAFDTWSAHIAPIEAGSVNDYVFKIVFIWITVTAAIVSLKRGKWLPTLGAILKVAILVFFLFTTVLYALQNGIVDLSLQDLSPTLSGFLGVTPLLLFAYLGFESGNSAAGEMQNPARDVPVSIARAAATAALCYLLPVLAILLVIPADRITGVAGLLEAVATVYTVYGAAAGPMLVATSVAFVFVLASQGAAWMIISDRMQAMAAADGAFFGGFFGVFHRELGTPIRVNMLSGVVATLFMLAAMTISGGGAAVFAVVLTISISTFLLSYLVAIPAAIRLRTNFPEVVRPFRVPVSDRGFRVMGLLCFAWVLLGSWVAVFPGTLEALFGVEYDFQGTWGVSRVEFEVFTLGTLGVLIALGLAGYVRGAVVRQATPAPVRGVEELTSDS